MRSAQIAVLRACYKQLRKRPKSKLRAAREKFFFEKLGNSPDPCSIWSHLNKFDVGSYRNSPLFTFLKSPFTFQKRAKIQRLEDVTSSRYLYKEEQKFSVKGWKSTVIPALTSCLAPRISRQSRASLYICVYGTLAAALCAPAVVEKFLININ